MFKHFANSFLNPRSLLNSIHKREPIIRADIETTKHNKRFKVCKCPAKDMFPCTVVRIVIKTMTDEPHNPIRVRYANKNISG